MDCKIIRGLDQLRSSKNWSAYFINYLERPESKIAYIQRTSTNKGCSNYYSRPTTGPDTSPRVGDGGNDGPDPRLT